jgi:RNA polymerase primary sigma factor
MNPKDFLGLYKRDRGILREIPPDFFGLLSEKERLVLQLRAGLGAEALHTLEQIGVRLSITKQRVGQIEKRARGRRARARTQ